MSKALIKGDPLVLNGIVITGSESVEDHSSRESKTRGSSQHAGGTWSWWTLKFSSAVGVDIKLLVASAVKHVRLIGSLLFPEGGMLYAWW